MYLIQVFDIFLLIRSPAYCKCFINIVSRSVEEPKRSLKATAKIKSMFMNKLMEINFKLVIYLLKRGLWLWISCSFLLWCHTMRTLQLLHPPTGHQSSFLRIFVVLWSHLLLKTFSSANCGITLYEMYI